ncbi:SRPBCC family protein [Saccharothrix sp. S26]|uniref:SRPBCC family protein n=1 Tax=Saccharothrix sp. S26 TaxID=2907215 RepID=UPI001F1609FC|nr:SRPBCC family protein [Saccharothrix sp. S26]MCE6999439.1 SRPBCC family protein [Saccharothrix sp. S26]
MTSYEHRAPVEMAARELFEFLARPGSLPQHLPGLSGSTPGIDHDRRRVSWAEGRYRGELTVVEDGAGRSQVTLAVETDEPGDVQRELEEALAAVVHRATAEADVEAAGKDDTWY